MTDNTIRHLDAKLVEAMTCLGEATQTLIASDDQEMKYELLEEIRKATNAINTVFDKIAEVA